MSQKKVYSFRGYEIKGMRPIFKTEMLIYQSKANLDETGLFSKITRHLDLGIRTMLVRGMFEKRIPYPILGLNLLAVEAEILFLS